MSKHLLIIPTLIFLLCVSPFTYAKIYKWKDKDGKVHFSDKPPKDLSITVEQQNIDNINVTSMPYPKTSKPMSIEQCQSAVKNLKNTVPLLKKDLEKELAKGTITDPLFAEALSALEQTEKQMNMNNCSSADPDTISAWNCLSHNKDGRRCLQ